MADETIVISGGTDGIGRVAAEQLGATAAHVFITGRSADKARAVVDGINRAAGCERASYLTLDLSSPNRVRRGAAEILERCPRIDVLINSAAVILNRRQETQEGYELTWATNHLGPFLLTNLLLERIVESAPARIVMLSSETQRSGHINFDDLQLTGRYTRYTMMGAYAQSKLANVMFTRSLAARLKNSGVTVNALHPGLIATNLVRGLGGPLGIFAFIFNLLFASSPEVGGERIVYLATSSEVAGVTGEYFDKDRIAASNPKALDEQTAERLWQLSQQAVGL